MTNKHLELPALSDKAILEIWDKSDTPSEENNWTTGALPFARAVIAAHEQARVVGEPVAWAATSEDGKVEALGFNQSRRFDTPLVFASPPAPQEAQAELSETAKDTIGRWLEADMRMAVMNGANSVSMPDELVEIAGWLFGAAAPVAQPATEQAEAPSVREIHSNRAAYDAGYEDALQAAGISVLIGEHHSAQPTASNAGEREALRQCVEALEFAHHCSGVVQGMPAIESAIIAGRAALASKPVEPVEPVAPPARELRFLTQKELDSIGSHAEGMDGQQWDRWVQEKFAEVNGLKVVGAAYGY